MFCFLTNRISGLWLVCVALFASFFISAENQAFGKPLVLFVPGYYGSELVHAQNKEVLWVSASEVLFGSQRLNVCQIRVQPLDCMPIKAGGLIREIDVIPWIYSLDIYGEAIEKLRHALGSDYEVKAFTYDWRQSPVSIGGRLIKRIESEQRPVYIVAHSFGGLVAVNMLGLLRKRRIALRNLKGLSTVGTPFGGTVFSLSNLINGRQVQMTGTLLDSVAFGTFPSVYFMLPKRKKLIFDSSGEDISESAENPEVWFKEKWAFFKLKSIKKKPAVAFINSQLNRKREQYKDFQKKGPLPINLSILNFRSKSKRALYSLNWNDKAKEIGDVSGKKYFRPGDGTVTYKSAKFPVGYRSALEEEVELQGDHTGMLVEKDFLARVKMHVKSVVSP